MRVTWQLSTIRLVLVAGLLLLAVETVMASGIKDQYIIAAVIYGKYNTATWEGFQEGME